MELINTIRSKPQAFISLCRKHRVDKVFGFGSAIREDFDKHTSDIDIVVELDIKDPVQYGDTLLKLWDDLENYFGRKVDLLTDASIRNPYLRKSVNQTKKLVYDGQGEKVFV
ncbi:MAG TPA: nucleotidyltransferase domain-containing protein [Chryseosolibacter sp.]